MAEVASSRYSLKTLVRIGVFAVLGLTFLLVVAALLLGGRMRGELGWTEHTIKVRALVSTLEREALQAESAERAYVYTGDEERLRDYGVVQNLAGRLEELQRMVGDSPEQLARIADLRRLVDAKVAYMERCVELKRNVQEIALRSLLATNEGVRLARSIHNKLLEIDAVESSLLSSRRQQAEGTRQLVYRVLLVGLAGELMVGFSILVFLGRRLAPLTQAATLAEKIGAGDLSSDGVRVLVDDEVGIVCSNLNLMLKNLKDQSSQNNSNAATVHQLVAGLALSAKQQAAALQQQSTATQQTAVTLEELAQSAGQIAERSREVASRADATSRAADLGLESVGRSAQSTVQLVEQVQMVAERIRALASKTDVIRGIVTAVDDIAERSNVLALNASLLASSNEGKGFTLVANEMKSLAEQSKEATVQVREILSAIERGIQVSANLVEEAGQRGAQGSRFTEEARASIHQLRAQVRDGSTAFVQITAATAQQKLAFEQVSEALVSIREASQQSAVPIRALESATHELQGLSEQLLKATGLSRPGRLLVPAQTD